MRNGKPENPAGLLHQKQPARVRYVPDELQSARNVIECGE
jgi:hypothetical protein